MVMLSFLEQALHHRSGLVRKGATLVLRGPKRFARIGLCDENLRAAPPALANSVPKSGTHLLDQILEALPGRRNFGEFLSSMTSSFQFRRRSPDESSAALRTAVPGELVRAHLFFDPAVAAAIAETRYVHYFIYRDPRDVVLSEAHYLRSLNRWHRLHPFFRDAPSLDEAIAISIRGLPEHAEKLYYPPIGERFEQYAGWIGRDDVFAVKFEDLTSDRQPEIIRQMAEFFATRSETPVDAIALADAMQHSIDPERSHTYRKGRSGGWRDKFTAEHHELFRVHGGEILSRYGFECDESWRSSPGDASAAS